MADRDSKAWKISSSMEPNFEGGLIHNDWIRATVFIKKSRAQRNAIPALSRSLNNEHTTMCFVKDEGFYVLINNPTGDSTTDSDWEAYAPTGGGSIIPIGNWDVSNTAPYLQDTDALGINGNFYYVTGAPNPVDVTHTGLFLGQTTQLINEDWVMSVGTHFIRVRNATTWESLNRPQSIIDYENGIVIAHPHEISDINNLQAILNSKWDDSNLADMVLDFVDVPNSGIPNVAFLRKHFYDKEHTYNRDEINALLSSISLGDPEFDGNRPIRKTPVVGENVGTSALGETIDEMFYGFIKPTDYLADFAVAEVGDSVTPNGEASYDPKDAPSYTGDVYIKDNLGNVGAQVTPNAPPSITNVNQPMTAKTIEAGEAQSYYVEYTYKEEVGGADILVQGPSKPLKGVYPFLSGMAATGLTGGGIYVALSKQVVDKGSRVFEVTGVDQRVYIAYPETHGDLVSITDEAGNELIGSLFPVSPVILAVQSVGLTINWQVNYKVYESNYDLSLTTHTLLTRFDNSAVEGQDLNLDQIAEGIVNKHFTATYKAKVDGITVPVGDIGDMSKSEFAGLVSISGKGGIVDKSIELIIIGLNNTGAPIAAGKYIKIVGIDIANFRVIVEIADSAASDIADGFANEVLDASGGDGIVVISGYNNKLDTTGQVSGTDVYLGPAGGVQYTEPTTGSLIRVGEVLFEGNPGLIRSLEYRNLLSESNQEEWRPYTRYPAHTLVGWRDAEGVFTLVRAINTHTSGASYNPAEYELTAGDMQKSAYDPDGDGIVEHAYNQTTTAKNDTGVIIVKGRLVYISNFNTVEGTAEISLADKDTPKAANAITDEDIADGAIGRIIINGNLIGINVPVVPLLTPLYLDTLGTFTAVKPLTGLIQIVGRVIYGNAAGAAYFDIGSPTNPIAEDWVTGRPYIVSESAIAVVNTTGDPPTEIPVIMRCKVAHTSNVLETDFTSGFWELISGDMVSWVYDAAQKKQDMWDMDYMDDGAAKVAMTIAERNKLGGLEDPNYKGIYNDPAALNLAYPAPLVGWSADVLSTNSKWVEDTGVWVDSLIAFGGDMQSSIYDPTAVGGDAFLMTNMAEGPVNKIFLDAERTKLGAFQTASFYYIKTEVDNLLALKAAITYVDAQDDLQMTITTYDIGAKGVNMWDMDNMDEGSVNLILLAAERAAIISNTNASHSHANKAILDAITAAGSGVIISITERAAIGDNTTARHTHANKALLDTIINSGSGEAFLSDDGDYKEAAKAGIHNGTCIEQQDLFIVETGGSVYCDVEKAGGGDLIIYFGEQSYILDCTTGTGVNGRARIILTAGLATDPALNAIYVYLNGGVPTLASTTDFDAIPQEFAWVGIATIRDAVNVAIEGPILLQRFTDAATHNGRGRISYIGERLRVEGAKWRLGVDPTATITPNVGALDLLDLSVLEGRVYQLHRQDFPALSVSVDGIYITKVDGTGVLQPYDVVTNLAEVNEYSDGTPIADGDFYNLVIWGAINKTTSDCKLFVNPSKASYDNSQAAYNDQAFFARLTVPEDLLTVAFLIARIPVKYTAVNNGTIEFINPVGLPNLIDLRGNSVEIRETSGAGASSAVAKILGGIYYDSGGAPTNTGNGEINGVASTLFPSIDNVDSPAPGRLRATVAGQVIVTMTLSSEMIGNNNSARLQLYLNGIPIAGAFASMHRGNQDTMNNPSISVPLNVAINDFVSIYHSGSNIDLHDYTLTFKGEA